MGLQGSGPWNGSGMSAQQRILCPHFRHTPPPLSLCPSPPHAAGVGGSRAAPNSTSNGPCQGSAPGARPCLGTTHRPYASADPKKDAPLVMHSPDPQAGGGAGRATSTTNGPACLWAVLLMAGGGGGVCSSVLDTNPSGVGEGVQRRGWGGVRGQNFLPFWGYF